MANRCVFCLVGGRGGVVGRYRYSKIIVGGRHHLCPVDRVGFGGRALYSGRKHKLVLVARLVSCVVWACVRLFLFNFSFCFCFCFRDILTCVLVESSIILGAPLRCGCAQETEITHSTAHRRSQFFVSSRFWSAPALGIFVPPPPPPCFHVPEEYY